MNKMSLQRSLAGLQDGMHIAIGGWLFNRDQAPGSGARGHPQGIKGFCHLSRARKYRTGYAVGAGRRQRVLRLHQFRAFGLVPNFRRAAENRPGSGCEKWTGRGWPGDCPGACDLAINVVPTSAPISGVNPADTGPCRISTASVACIGSRHPTRFRSLARSAR